MGEKTKINTPYGSADVGAGQIAMILALPIIVGLAGYFLVYRPILRKMNVLKTKEDKETQNIVDTVKSQPFWTPNFYKTQGGHTITAYSAQQFATTLFKAMHGVGGAGWWNPLAWGTDEAKILGVFNTLGTKGNISMVVEAYGQKYNTDLYADLASELSNDDMLEIAQKISLYAS